MATVPLIPEPDYDSIDNSFQHHYIPTYSKTNQNLMTSKNLLDRYEKISKLQYSRPVNKERALRIAKLQGVPVFPFNNMRESHDSDKIIIPNKAMLVHVKNHRNFDDEGHTFKSCKNCIICKCSVDVNSISSSNSEDSCDKNHDEIVSNQLLLEHLPQEPSYLPPLLIDLSNDFEKNLTFPRSQRDREYEQYIKSNDYSFLNNDDVEEQTTMKIIVMRNFYASRLDELTVRQGQLVELITIKDSWCLVKNSEEIKGWIPYPDSFS
uniref:SH3 domain-containing protein n=1 Tax=Parastrongyloides trichosuri TaxID=131310 RepID=A0A0N4ZJW6_PARTI